MITARIWFTASRDKQMSDTSCQCPSAEVDYFSPVAEVATGSATAASLGLAMAVALAVAMVAPTGTAMARLLAVGLAAAAATAAFRLFSHHIAYHLQKCVRQTVCSGPMLCLWQGIPQASLGVRPTMKTKRN